MSLFPRKRKRPEQALHIAVGQFLDVVLPPRALWWHTPNGGGRTKAEAGIFKAMGVRAGMPDILVLSGGKLVAIELKPPGGRASIAQEVMSEKLVAAGCGWALCDSIEGVQRALELCGVPLRATIDTRAA